MRNNEKKNRHMTLDDQVEMQECLSKGMTFIPANRGVSSPKLLSKSF
jgi:hypothetical protein